MPENQPRHLDLEFTESFPIPAKPEYLQTLNTLIQNPFSDESWRTVLALARSEQSTGEPVSNYYSKIPLDELEAFGNKLIATETHTQRLDLLVIKSSLGKLWYDIILGHANSKMRAPLTKHLQLLADKKPPGQLVAGLDLGSGTGNLTVELSCFADSTIAVDSHELSVKYAQSRTDYHHFAVPVVGDATNLKLRNNSFDIAVSSGLIFYLGGKEHEFAKSISRALTPGASYFDTIVLQQEDELIMGTEREYLSSAKALAVLQLDRLCTHLNTPNVNLHSLVNEFAQNGLDFTLHPPDNLNAALIQFTKPNSR